MDNIILITSNIAPYRLAWCEELANYYRLSIAYTKDHDFERFNDMCYEPVDAQDNFCRGCGRRLTDG